MVMVSPRLMSPSLRFQRSVPVAASTADDLGVEGGEVEHAVGVGRAAVHDVAAGDALGEGVGLGLVAPLHRRVGLGEIEGVEDVWVRGDEVERAVDHQRGGFLALVDAGVEGEGDIEAGDVGVVDVAEFAVAGVGVVLAGALPLAVVGRRSGGRGGDLLRMGERRQQGGGERDHCGGETDV